MGIRKKSTEERHAIDVQNSACTERLFTYMLLKESAAVVVENGWQVLVVRRGRSQAVVQGQCDRGQFVPELIVLLRQKHNVKIVT